ncbi:MAG: transposase [Deltaproteobacteria bacterium]|nr:transposase [Deltaproteobacteria bacterium]
MAQIIPLGPIRGSQLFTLLEKWQGPLGLSWRMALAALTIKERLGVSEEEGVEQIRENRYLQYFCGLKKLPQSRSCTPPCSCTSEKLFLQRSYPGSTM